MSEAKESRNPGRTPGSDEQPEHTRSPGGESPGAGAAPGAAAAEQAAPQPGTGRESPEPGAARAAAGSGEDPPGSGEAAGTGEEAASGSAPPGEPAQAELEAEVRDLKARLEHTHNDQLRLAAEMENTRKRAAREVENARRYGIERLAGELLEVVDSLELGMEAARRQQAPEALLEGQQATLRLLLGALEKVGVRRIEARGERFDPQYHEAMSMVNAPDSEPGTVTSVVQTGYLIHDRLLRPARVMVAADPAEGEGG